MAHNEKIICPDGVDRVDFEAELAVIIKKRAKNIDKGSANEYILGYTCFNDVTARELQGKTASGQGRSPSIPLHRQGLYSYRYKPDNLDIKLLQNGIVRQHSNLSKLIWNIDFLMEEISKIMTLLPGDIIATGTPPGAEKWKRATG